MSDRIDPLAAALDDGVVEQPFTVDRGSHEVPGIAWYPAGAASALPVVLLGHGGSGHKRDPRIVERATGFVRHAGLAAVAIDGPQHGDRAAGRPSSREYQERIVAEGVDRVTDRMVGDWTSTVRALGRAAPVDAAQIGYVGLSMGARFGIPVAAALGARLRCAVLGKFGLAQAPEFPAGYRDDRRIRADAARIRAPTLLHVQWDDELFPLGGQLELFERLGSPDKLLVAQPGPHAATHPGAEHMWRDFVRTHLRPPVRP